jgi:hypothetical protein
MPEKQYAQSTSNFEAYREENKDNWHFDPSVKSNDYEYLGKLNVDFNPLLELMKDDKNFKEFRIVEKIEGHDKLNSRIEEFRKWGFSEHNTKSLQMTDKDFPEIFKPYKEFSGLNFCNVVALKQYPGQFLPWHIDTLVGIRKEYDLADDVQVIRYSLVLEDWKWGHYFLAGNSILHQWKQGDIIQLAPNMHHTTCNSGIEPKLTMTVTGVLTEKSKEIKKSKKFEHK